MQNFSLQRFGKVLRKDLRRLVRVRRMLLGNAVGMVLFWTLYLMDGGLDVSQRCFNVCFLAGISSMIICEALCGKVNDPQAGVGFALLPATALEKYLSMFVTVVLVTTLSAVVVATLIDSLLALLHVGGVTQFLWQDRSITSLSLAVDGLLLFLSSTFWLVTTLCFQRYRYVKQIIIFVLCTAVVTVVAIGCSISWLQIGIMLLSIVLLSWLGVHRLKRMKY